VAHGHRVERLALARDQSGFPTLSASSGSGARSSRDPLVAVRCAHEPRTLGRREDGRSTPESGSIGAFRILLPWANSGNPQHGNCRCFRHSNAMLPLMESFKSGRRQHGGVTPPVERQNSKPFFYLSALLGAREQTKLYRLVRLTCVPLRRADHDRQSGPPQREASRVQRFKSIFNCLSSAMC
jgi:hypothetical protein